MRIAVDFDNTVVAQDRPYADATTPLEFIPGAKEGLLSLKRAGHLLLLWSGRASRALLLDPSLDPFVRSGAVKTDRRIWNSSRSIHRARYEQMVAFVEKELPGVFDAIDDGLAGKPNVDLFIDDKALTLRGPGTWTRIAHTYGDEQGEETPVVELLDRQVESLLLVPSGPLANILGSIRQELASSGIVHFEPVFTLGHASFWCIDRAITINIPWFLANEELRAFAYRRYPWKWGDVLRAIRHEVAHSVNYAFELWKRPDWADVFGDFLEPYPLTDSFPVEQCSEDFVTYMRDVGAGYAQKHPDEDWAETFACWLDPMSCWRDKYVAGGARRKLDLVQSLADGPLREMPSNLTLGSMDNWREAYRGQTVRQALALPDPNKEKSNGS